MNAPPTSEPSMVDAKELAERIEAEIFAASKKSTDNNYRSSVRSHFLNLKATEIIRRVVMDRMKRRP